MRNAFYWVEIPATNFDRAKKFYEAIFNIEMMLVQMARGKYAIFPLERTALGAGGAIVEGEGYEPCDKGRIIYLDRGEEDLNIPLSRVEKAGGKILLAKTINNENMDAGFIALFIDSEGNKMGLHSQN